MVSDFLKHGAENACSTSELVRLTGAKSARELQIQIARERNNGALIISTCLNGGGYFLPDDGEKGKREIEGFVRTLQSRVLNTLKAVQVAKKALQDIDGQLEI